MLTEKFDPYGEVSPATARENRRAARMESASVALDRAGQFAFWLLVVVIVSARIIWYPVAPPSNRQRKRAEAAGHAIAGGGGNGPSSLRRLRIVARMEPRGTPKA